MLKDNTFEVFLRNPIEVHGAGAEVTTLVFHECSIGYDSHYMKLHKLMLSGVMKAPELLEKFSKFAGTEDAGTVDDNKLKSGGVVERLHEVDEETHEKQAADMAMMMGMALGSSDELEELVEVFASMLGQSNLAPICETDNGSRVQPAAWDRIHVKDKMEMAVLYCCFFGIGLDMMLQSGSDTASASLTQAKAR